MPQKMHWSQLTDLQLHRLRAEGATWNTIAAALRLSHSTVIQHGRRIGLTRQAARVLMPAPLRELVDPGREPLPPGHPVSWAVITDGTSLAGTRYPAPWTEWEQF